MSCPSVSARLAADVVRHTYACFAVAVLLGSISRRLRSSAETLQCRYCLCGSQLTLSPSPDISVCPSCWALLHSLSNHSYSWPQLLAFESSPLPKNLLCSEMWFSTHWCLLPAARLSASQIQPFSLSHLSTVCYLSSLGPRNAVLFRTRALISESRLLTSVRLSQI